MSAAITKSEAIYARRKFGDVKPLVNEPKVEISVAPVNVAWAYPVERGVPMPSQVHGRGGRAAKYPWVALGVGDSFLVPGDGGAKQFNALSSNRNWAQKQYGRKFALRKVEGGLRVWRTA